MMTIDKYKEFLKEQYGSFEEFKDEYILPCDVAYKKNESNSKIIDERKKLHTKLLPELVVGSLETGKIFLCNGNPGFSEQDYEDLEELGDNMLEKLQQKDASFFWLTEKYAKTGGGKWWRKKFNQKDKKKSLVANIIKGYADNNVHITEEDVFSLLSKLVVDLELIPYHSKIKPTQIQQLSSTINQLDFVHNYLVPNASVNNHIICFIRSIKSWGVSAEEKEKAEVCCNEKDGKGIRAVTLNVELEVGQKIFAFLKKYTGDFSILPLNL